jgi:hypothetical protein
MKYFFLLVGCALASVVFAQQNYVVQIGDSSYNVFFGFKLSDLIAGKESEAFIETK